MLANNLGYPRMGNHRQLKKVLEQYWAGQIEQHQLHQTAKDIRMYNWKLQQDAGVDLIPSNDFSLYDQVLDMCLMTGAIPKRFHDLIEKEKIHPTDLYFAMARGYQKGGYDITAMEMTKWFDTNYHYIVPEFYANQSFSLLSGKIISEFHEAKREGYHTKPVIIGPVSFLLLGKEKEEGFHRLELLKQLLPVYKQIIGRLDELNVTHIQFDEPFLSLDLSEVERLSIKNVYTSLNTAFPHIKIILTSYFECYGRNLPAVLSLPVHAIHLDLVRCPAQLDDILATAFVTSRTSLSLGVVDGRNIWKNDFEQSLLLINKAIKAIGKERVMIAASCSLLHSPADLGNETTMHVEIKNWLSFAKQKIQEVASLKQIASGNAHENILQENQSAILSKKQSDLIHNPLVKERVAAIKESDAERKSVFAVRQQVQKEKLQLPLFPTTTIGSFPQTNEVRVWRAKWKRGELTNEEYDALIKKETAESIAWQEAMDMDVLVHGEFERNDMVEYFGEQLNGFVFTQNGWVQSYGSRCVKPPVIYGDIYRKAPMTVYWSSYAQSLTKKYMKGMLTGPVTILQWSFVRNDQPREITTMQIALAIRDEVSDLEADGIKIIQIDEPAIREGLPLRKENWQQYLAWAVKAFKVSSCCVQNDTQIHTHTCYSEFNDIIESIAAMDADVITIETSRSQMELLDAFAAFNYPNEIGPGIYDIHSPRVPSVTEMELLVEKALQVIPAQNLWINPDCGLKTRHWPETKEALKNMVTAAKAARRKYAQVTV